MIPLFFPLIIIIVNFSCLVFVQEFRTYFRIDGGVSVNPIIK